MAFVEKMSSCRGGPWFLVYAIFGRCGVSLAQPLPFGHRSLLLGLLTAVPACGRASTTAAKACSTSLCSLEQSQLQLRRSAHSRVLTNPLGQPLPSGHRSLLLGLLTAVQASVSLRSTSSCKDSRRDQTQLWHPRCQLQEWWPIGALRPEARRRPCRSRGR